MRKFSLIMFIVLSLILMLAACGGGDSGDSSDSGGESVSVAVKDGAGDAANGEKLYKQPIIGDSSAPGCNTCHSLEEGVVLTGPSHAGIAEKAKTAVSGLSAEEYLHKSITDPNADITEGFTEGVMWPSYGDDLTEEEINDLVAFLLTQ